MPSLDDFAEFLELDARKVGEIFHVRHDIESSLPAGIVLAGGKSARMGGEDKAFLPLNGRPFICGIVEELEKVCDELLVVIGNKPKSKFEELFSGRARIINDSYNLESPLGGLMTAFEITRSEYAIAVACDTPFVTSELFLRLLKKANSRQAVVPIWRSSGAMEPLCAAYQVRAALAAANRAVLGGNRGCRHMIAELRNVAFVDGELLSESFELSPFSNINTKKDYWMLLENARRQLRERERQKITPLSRIS